MAGLKIEKWDTCEIALASSGRYDNPFTDVELTATFLHVESGREIEVHGFYDGDDTWRIRFMPLEIGSWRYETKSIDSGLNGKSGTVEAVKPEKAYLHGPLHARGLHFCHADGTRRFLTSTRLSCQFASPSVWDEVVAFLSEHRINRVLFIMGGIAGTVRDLYGVISEGPDLDFSRYNPEKFRAIDSFIDTLRNADMLASPYFYYFNDRDQCGMTPEEDRAYIRYGMARFGSYCNVMPCLSNQVEGKYTMQGRQAEQYDARNFEWANEMGRYLAGRAVFGVPVTVHNPLENRKATNPSFYTLLRDWQFPWADYMLRQMQIGALGCVSEFRDDMPEQMTYGAVKGDGDVHFSSLFNPRAYDNQNGLLADLSRFGIPVINEEPGYEMQGRTGARHRIDPRSYNSQTSERLLTTFWTATLAGAYSMWGSNETYCMDDPLPGMQNSSTPRYIKVLHDFMVKLPYWEMEPDNDAVSPFEIEIEGKGWRTNFCLSKRGEIYLVFSTYGDSVQMTIPEGGSYRVLRLDPRTGQETDLGSVPGEVQEIGLPKGEWVLLLRRTR